MGVSSKMRGLIDRPRPLALLGLLAFLGMLGVCAATSPAASRPSAKAHGSLGGPVLLGSVWGSNQSGYGEAHPKTIFNGGDPTGLVRGIKWKHWGARRAWGWGSSIFVWPGLSVAEGLRARARVVAFHLGTCEGRAAYNAVVWFFPAYHQHFHPDVYGDICSAHHPHGFRYHPTHCGGVQITRQTRAVEITTEHMNCRSARRLLRTSPSQRYAVTGGRFRHRGFYCGSMGWGEIGPPSIFECALDLRSVVFEVYSPG
jgi:hypothetical protein